MLSVEDTAPPPPAPAAFNLAAHVLAAGRATPDKIALAVLGPARAERWSFARLEAAVLGTATGLRRAGLAPGDRLMMRLGSSVDFPVAYLGAIACGVIPVPTSAQWTAAEAGRAAALIAPRAILAAPGVALPDTPGARVIDLDSLRAMRALPPAAYRQGAPDRPAYIVFTSGSSGRLQAVVHAHRAIWARRMMHDGWYGLHADDRLMHAGAFNWSFTLGTGLLDPWSVGATALIPAEGTTHDALPLLLGRHDATIFAAAPGVFRKLLRRPAELTLPTLRHALSAGEKLPETTRTGWWAATGTEIHEAYGMTECSTFISGSPARAAPLATLGYPQAGRKVAILGPAGPVPRGQTGEIAVSLADPGLMLGYHDDPDASAAKTRDGWFLTGDTGVMGDDGAIAYQGRNDDMLNAGGFRVSPIEVERALAEHPQIGEVAAIDYRLSADTSVIAAFYTADADLTETDLGPFCAERLARYKCPRFFRRIASLPRSANGKILRKQLRNRELEIE